MLTRCRIIERELGSCRDLLARSHRKAVRPEAAFFDMQIDASHLRALIAVHDFRSVQRAARLLAVSQSAISYSMRLLRADLGIQLAATLPERTICLLQRQDARQTAAVRDFLNVVRAVAGTDSPAIQAT